MKREQNLWVIDLEKGTGQRITSTFAQMPVWSPDGTRLAYSAAGGLAVKNANGALGADKKRISTSGGRLPVWRRDNRGLFFIAPDGTLMSAAVKTGGTEFQFAVPKTLFKTRMLGWIGNAHEYDVSPDGQRFLIGTLIGEPTAPPPTVILNWTAQLKK